MIKVAGFYSLFALLASSSFLTLVASSATDAPEISIDNENFLRGSPVERHLSGGGCISKYTITLTAKCDWIFLKQGMQGFMNQRSQCRGRTPEDELREILQEPTMTDDEISEHVKKICVDAFDNDRLFNGFSLDEIFAEEEGEPVEFFNGRGPINSRRETSTTKFGNTIDNVKTGVGGKFKAIQDHYANQFPFPWPGEGNAKSIPNFEQCELNAAMCCWSQDRQANDNNGNCAKAYDTKCNDADPADNVDICLVNMSDEPSSAHGKQHGFAVFPGDNDQKPGEGAMHCHGFAWGDDDTDLSKMYRGNNLFYVSLYDHVFQRGYVSSVPGAPQCACVEKMPIVSRADCTEINKSKFKMVFTIESGEIDLDIQDSIVSFAACKGLKVNNDLEDYYKRLVKEKRVKDQQKEFSQRLVGKGNCPKAIDQFFVKLFIGEVGKTESDKVQQRAQALEAASSDADDPATDPEDTH